MIFKAIQDEAAGNDSLSGDPGRDLLAIWSNSLKRSSSDYLFLGANC